MRPVQEYDWNHKIVSCIYKHLTAMVEEFDNEVKVTPARFEYIHHLGHKGTMRRRCFNSLIQRFSENKMMYDKIYGELKQTALEDFDRKLLHELAAANLNDYKLQLVKLAKNYTVVPPPHTLCPIDATTSNAHVTHTGTKQTNHIANRHKGPWYDVNGKQNSNNIAQKANRHSSVRLYGRKIYASIDEQWVSDSVSEWMKILDLENPLR